MIESTFFQELFSTTGLIAFVEVMVLIIEILYVLFSFVIIAQVRLLNRSFKTSSAFAFNVFSYVHLFLAIGLFVLSYILF